MPCSASVIAFSPVKRHVAKGVLMYVLSCPSANEWWTHKAKHGVKAIMMSIQNSFCWQCQNPADSWQSHDWV